MRPIILVSLIFLQCITSHAQKNLYDFVKLGEHQVAFTDTLILDARYGYTANDYEGQKPYFIQIWHPTKKSSKQNYLRVNDLFIFKQHPDLKTVQEKLSTEYKNLFIRDYLTENLQTGGVNNYGEYTYGEVFDLIGKLETRSIPYSLIEDSDFPVIVYHNGSQGHPFENFAMAEYFASRGFIFMAASFELQFENCAFGMLPYERYITDEEEESVKALPNLPDPLATHPLSFL